uniref:Uncharacterized protein n=1 Tax=Anguilla anguilla TaxID=7936 RepID=A0A0E9VZR7_ANGAN
MVVLERCRMLAAKNLLLSVLNII